jgi:hypothetical protein
MLATHWDRYPSSLGADLLHCDKSIEAVVEVAKAHTIDAAHALLLDTLTRERISQLAQDHQLTVQEIKTRKRRGNVICADDYEIADIGLHRDLAEFQYDIRGNEVYIRALDGWWTESMKQADEFERPTEKAVAGSRALKRERC